VTDAIRPTVCAGRWSGVSFLGYRAASSEELDLAKSGGLSATTERDAHSPLEGTGFELSVPRGNTLRSPAPRRSPCALACCLGGDSESPSGALPFTRCSPKATLTSTLSLLPLAVARGFEASVGLGPIDRRRGGIIRMVVGLGKPIELFGRPKEPPLTAEINVPTLFGGWRGIAELNFRIHSPPAESPQTIGSRTARFSAGYSRRQADIIGMRHQQ